MKKNNIPDDKIKTPKKKRGKNPRFRSLDKDDLESTLFLTLLKKDGEDKGYCLLCDFNQESHKSNHKRHFLQITKI